MALVGIHRQVAHKTKSEESFPGFNRTALIPARRPWWTCTATIVAHCTMARSLSAWLRCFLALYPGRRNSIFLFLASILFLCFLSFFLAAMSGLATACKTEGERKYKWSSCYCVRVCALVVHPTCMALCRLRAARLCENSFWTAEKARENLCSPTCFFSSSISSCARFFSVGSGHGKRVQWNQCVGILKGYLTVFWSFFFFLQTDSEQLPWSA